MSSCLPPELVDMIIQHLSGNRSVLRRCALVSRTWSVFSQGTLFRNTRVNLKTYKKMVTFLEDLISIPHLQTLIRCLSIYQRRDDDDILFAARMSCLATVLSLLPNLMRVAFENEDLEDVGTPSYLDLIPNVLRNARLVELDIDIYSVESFQHVFETLGRTNVRRVGLSGFVEDYTVDLGTTRKLLHLPALEGIRFEVDGLQEEFHTCLTHYFALPNLKQCEIYTEFVDDWLRWRDVLLQGFPPLELFKLELGIGFTDDIDFTAIAEEDAYQPIPLAGLQFQHVHLTVNPQTLNTTRKFIEWWSSTFRALSDSKATIHFTELTFTFMDLSNIETLKEAWNSLDVSLAHTTFSGVRTIHFKLERRRWQGGKLITHTAHNPVLVDRMRLVLPLLTSRGVLRFD